MERWSNFESLGDQHAAHRLVNAKMAEGWWWFQRKVCWRVFGNFHTIRFDQQLDHMQLLTHPSVGPYNRMNSLQRHTARDPFRNHLNRWNKLFGQKPTAMKRGLSRERIRLSLYVLMIHCE